MKQLTLRGISLLAALALVVFGAILVQAAPAAQEEADQTVAEVIQSNEAFSELAGAIEAADLDEQLAGEGPFTVFAPTDAAIEALPEGLPSGAELTDLLLSHVVPGEVDAASGSATNALGDELEISGEGEDMTVNGVAVGEAIVAANGVVYAVESVLETAAPAEGEEAAPAEGEEGAAMGAAAAAGEEGHGIANDDESDDEPAGVARRSGRSRGHYKHVWHGPMRCR